MKKKDFIKIYTLQKKIRVVEEKIAENYKHNKMRCPTHLSIGQEAIAVSACMALKKEDIVVSYHRSHAHYLSKGGNQKKLFAELHGYEEGCSKGVGGSMHLIDLDNNFYGSTAIVSNTIPIGVGLAYSLKLSKKKNLACIFLGDAAVEEGVFFESLNFSVLKKLPAVFICENNSYSVYTHINQRQPIGRKIHKLANGIGAKSFILSQKNPFLLYKKLKSIFNQARSKNQVFFIEIDTCRYLEHCGPNDDSKLGYRSLKDLNSWKKNDPINFSKKYLLNNKYLSKKKILLIDNKITKEVNRDFNSIKFLKIPNYKKISNLVFKNK